MPRTPHIPWRADTTQSRDCELPRRCPRCLPSRLPRHCPRSLPSRLPRRCLRWPRTRLPRYCLQSRPNPRLRRCPCWRSSPQLSRCQGQPLSPTELPQTHPLSQAMTSASFGGSTGHDRKRWRCAAMAVTRPAADPRPQRFQGHLNDRRSDSSTRGCRRSR